jgi:hypothetical protein
MSDEQNRDGIPPEVTARYTELMRKYGSGPLPLLEKLEAVVETAKVALNTLENGCDGCPFDKSETDDDDPCPKGCRAGLDLRAALARAEP